MKKLPQLTSAASNLKSSAAIAVCRQVLADLPILRQENPNILQFLASVPCVPNSAGVLTIPTKLLLRSSNLSSVLDDSDPAYVHSSFDVKDAILTQIGVKNHLDSAMFLQLINQVTSLAKEGTVALHLR